MDKKRDNNIADKALKVETNAVMEKQAVEKGKKRPKPSNGEENKENKLQPMKKMAKETKTENTAFNLAKINVEWFFERARNDQDLKKKIDSIVPQLRREKNLAQRTANCCSALMRFILEAEDEIEATYSGARFTWLIFSNVAGIDAAKLLDALKHSLKAFGGQQAALIQMTAILCILQVPHSADTSPKLVLAIYQILVAHLNGPELLALKSTNILIECLKLLPLAMFEEDVWPLLQPHLDTPMSRGQCLNTCDLLLSVHATYPWILGRNQVISSLWPHNTQLFQLFQLYFVNTTMQTDDGVFCRLGFFVAGGGRESISAWQQFADCKHPLKRNGSRSFILQVMTYILLNFKEKDMQSVLDLFTPTCLNFVQCELGLAKANKGKSMTAVQAKLSEICVRFDEALARTTKRKLQSRKDKKMQLLLRYLEERIHQDAQYCLPRFTPNVMQQLDGEELKKLHEHHTQMVCVLKAIHDLEHVDQASGEEEESDQGRGRSELQRLLSI